MSINISYSVKTYNNEGSKENETCNFTAGGFNWGGGSGFGIQNLQRHNRYLLSEKSEDIILLIATLQV